MRKQTLPLFPALAQPAEVVPALKWAGGKRWLLPQLEAIWQRFAGKYRLVEPFVGGMGVALGLQPMHALLNDANEHLINFYHWLQRGLVIEFPMLNEEAAFYAARARFNQLAREQARTAEAAGLFYYLNRTCFNGLCRFNSRNEFNVPFGRYKKINYLTDFAGYIPTLQNWQVQQGDFAQVVLGRHDFLYVDPPYDTPFSQYAKDDFTWADQLRLVEWLGQVQGPVVATNQATPRVLALYREAKFDVQTLLAPRRIASSGDRTPALEMLATKNIS